MTCFCYLVKPHLLVLLGCFVGGVKTRIPLTPTCSLNTFDAQQSLSVPCDNMDTSPDCIKSIAHAMIDEVSCLNGCSMVTIRCCDSCHRQIRYGQDSSDDVFLAPGETPPSRPSRLLCWRCENTVEKETNEDQEYVYLPLGSKSMSISPHHSASGIWAKPWNSTFWCVGTCRALCAPADLCIPFS